MTFGTTLVREDIHKRLTPEEYLCDSTFGDTSTVEVQQEAGRKVYHSSYSTKYR